MKNTFSIIISTILLFGCNQKKTENSSDIFESITIENYPFTLAPALFDNTLKFDHSAHEKEFLNIDTLLTPNLNFNSKGELKLIDTIIMNDVTFDITRFYFFKRLKPINRDIEVLLYMGKNNEGNLAFTYLITYDKRKKVFLDNKVLMINGFGDDIKTYISGCSFINSNQIESIVEYHFFGTDILHRKFKIEQNGSIKEINRRHELEETWEEDYEDNSSSIDYSYPEYEDLPYEITGEEDNDDFQNL
jgi:hypothetical protein